MENNENDYTAIYKYADAPIMMGNWQIDQFLVFVVSFYLVNIATTGVSAKVIGCGAAYGLVWLYGKYKSGAVRGKGRQMIYSLGFKKPKTLPPSDERLFIGG